ncbi:AsmA-like C-terminal region-containing protein [Paracrocinitomix mangrovi]|uniref:AsmA family protein n=1 Tax=Paracrocinitomix mangrovi TaxID=2862509 RepID=UPI001C8EE45A|nr:AsmA-like C-terminal region-containing protein [Paracrocinitomix mangrovi]UKN00382.1 AsmA-like C-terminal region-containing protein [Paracrocinitomix mangrovi]
MRKALKILRKFLFWIFFVSLFLTTVVTVLLHIYEDDIKQFAIDELNDRLTTDVEVQDIQLSFFHDFPNASVEFKKVFIADAFPEIESDDTLFYAEKMFFNFNLMDFYSGDYQVRRINVYDGCLYLKTAKDGQANFNIIKDREETQEESKFEFMLELLKVENFKFRYKNLAARQFYDLDIHKGLFQGDFSDDQYKVIAETEMKIERVKSNSFNLITDKESNLNLELDVNTIAKSYTFKKGDLLVEKMPFHLTGIIDSTSIDLELSGNEIELADLANSLVDEKMEKVKSYESEGIISFNSKIHGPLSAIQMPAIEAEFNIKNGKISEPESKLTITDVYFEGHYQNAQEGRKEEMKLENVQLRLLDSYFKGRATISDFEEPTLNTAMEGDLRLDKFHQFFNFKNVEKLGGQLSLNCRAVVKFFDPQYNQKNFDVLKSDGSFILKDVLYKGVNDDITYRNMSGEIVLYNKDAGVNQLQIKTAKSDILVNGSMKNFMPFLDGTGNLGLIASIESNNLDLNEFMANPEPEENKRPKIFELPANLNLNVDLSVANLHWDGHQFNTINTNLLMASREVKLNNLDFGLQGGKAHGNLVMKNRMEKGNIIDGKLTFNNVDVKGLFKDWDNFKQSSITSQHISGTASGSIDFLLSFNPYFSLKEDELYAKCNLKIKNGELNELETMKMITDYMRSNKGLKLMLNKHIDAFEDKLLHLKFATIENEITIKDRKLIIPKMTIGSNALDVDLFGWHSFDNMIDYHFSFRFRELKEQVTENEFGIIEDDGLGLVIYLNMSGDLFDPTFALDGTERRKQIKESIAEEKQNVKSILKTELGFFKKDSTVQKIEEDNKEEIKFIMYDEEDEQSQDSIPGKIKRKDKTNDFNKTLLKYFKADTTQKQEEIIYDMN